MKIAGICILLLMNICICSGSIRQAPRTKPQISEEQAKYLHNQYGMQRLYNRFTRRQLDTTEFPVNHGSAVIKIWPEWTLSTTKSGQYQLRGIKLRRLLQVGQVVWEYFEQVLNRDPHLSKEYLLCLEFLESSVEKLVKGDVLVHEKYRQMIGKEQACVVKLRQGIVFLANRMWKPLKSYAVVLIGYPEKQQLYRSLRRDILPSGTTPSFEYEVDGKSYKYQYLMGLLVLAASDESPEQLFVFQRHLMQFLGKMKELYIHAVSFLPAGNVRARKHVTTVFYDSVMAESIRTDAIKYISVHKNIIKKNEVLFSVPEKIVLNIVINEKEKIQNFSLDVLCRLVYRVQEELGDQIREFSVFAFEDDGKKVIDIFTSADSITINDDEYDDMPSPSSSYHS